jgi:ADP-ribose pyrophosphatase YjhB (NUDIX family)
MYLGEGKSKIVFVCEIFITCGKEILFFKRKDTAKLFPGYLSVPGGHIDYGETPIKAIVREVKEETGIKLATKIVKLKHISLHEHLDRKEILQIFGFSAVVSSKPTTSSRLIEGKAMWLTPSQAKKTGILFPPVAEYMKHSTNPTSGLMYNYSTWKKAELVENISETINKA